jgi:fimbrial chaperone protein
MRALRWIPPALLALLAFSGAANAGSLRVGPTLIVLDAEHPVAIVRITNNNAVTTAIDVRANAWRQADNQDVYEETRRLIVTPAVFDLAAGEMQTVRVGLNPTANVDTRNVEQSFRLFVAELPGPRSSAAPTQMLMRIGVPVFVATADAHSQLVWQLREVDEGMWRLEATNHGSAHARVLRLGLRSSGTPLADEIRGDHVLPGATRTWKVSMIAPVADLAEVELDIAHFADADQHVKLSPQRYRADVALADSAR